MEYAVLEKDAYFSNYDAYEHIPFGCRSGLLSEANDVLWNKELWSSNYISDRRCTFINNITEDSASTYATLNSSNHKRTKCEGHKYPYKSLVWIRHLKIFYFSYITNVVV
jgi:hypothetical protein